MEMNKKAKRGAPVKNNVTKQVRVNQDLLNDYIKTLLDHGTMYKNELLNPIVESGIKEAIKKLKQTKQLGLYEIDSPKTKEIGTYNGHRVTLEDGVYCFNGLPVLKLEGSNLKAYNELLASLPH